MNKSGGGWEQRSARVGVISFVLRRVVVVIGLSVFWACEAQWGGVQVKVGEPEYERPSTQVMPDTTVEVAPLALPTGPVVFHVRRLDAAGRAEIEPVAEVTPAGLEPVGPQRAEQAEAYVSRFNEAYYPADRAYTLFRDGARSGTFYVEAPRVSGSGLCLHLAAGGQLELRPRADTLSEFVAWPVGVRAASDGLTVPGYREDMTAMAQVLARRGVEELALGGAWRFARPADLRALAVGDGPFGFAATFTVGDSLTAGSPADSAGMVFVVADFSRSVGYFPLHLDAVWYGPGQKRVLRWIDSVNLLGDERSEWLLRAYGDGDSWYEVLAPSDTAVASSWSSRRPVCEVQQTGP